MDAGKERFGTSIDYEEVAEKYDELRNGNPKLVKILVEILSPSSGSLGLDVGCGTGNNTMLFVELTNTRIVGLDLSHEMLCRARRKLRNSALIRGKASALPFGNEVFDFVFMTEVIHHLPEKKQALNALREVMKTGGKLCIVTQSHKQIEDRVTSRFFPSTIAVDQARYPSIAELKGYLSEGGFVEVRIIQQKLSSQELGNDFLDCVANKGYSMLHKISEEEYEKGLRKLKSAMKEQTPLSYALGYTFVYAMSS